MHAPQTKEVLPRPTGSKRPPRTAKSARAILVRLHRWFGLSAAVFLFIAGLTGAIIAWDHELDGLLNPTLYFTQSTEPVRSVAELADLIEQRDPRVQVRYMPLAPEAGHAFIAFVEPRAAAAGTISDPGYDQIFVDPVTGQTLGARTWGEFSLARQNLLPFIYKLHYSLHLHYQGFDWGVLLMGCIAIAWVLDCFVALWISFPKLDAWRKSFAFRWKSGGMRLTFDLHRSGGVLIWPLLLLVAVTSVSMNLEHQVVRPLISLVSPLTPSPFFAAERQSLNCAQQTCLSRPQILAIAMQEASQRKISQTPGGLFLSNAGAIYGVGFFSPGNDHGDGGLGNPWLYFDAQNGKLLGASIPGQGSMGDVFMQAQFPIHSGRMIGLPGRILVTALGLLVAMLSVTGLILWAKKRRSSQLNQQNRKWVAQPSMPTNK
ncbi:PepSY-associated TM helix domain-containing protein [Uliginosibacterium gangwonense]|uniref:PepSY-associated TM helix domain-containing protein n=1 Tax=Uliginosibacterium gangwonense TaxID=392736 RepID=UPI0012F87A36|nr:PepSY-associated TM helix domain-containing protein [Uliginosibacterium gangwonense]